MFENIRMNDTIRGRLEHVVTEFKKFSNVTDVNLYHENAIRIIRMTSCSICQILHGNLRGEISHEDMVKLLKVFINSEKRINKLVVLLSDKETCWYEPIKMAIQIEDMSDINRCITSHDDDVCTVINRALLVYRNKNKAEDLFNIMKGDINDPKVKNELTVCVTNIAVFLDPSILTNENKTYESKPVIDNSSQHVHSPNYTCKEHVKTDVLPNPQPHVSVPPTNPVYNNGFTNNAIPSILPGQQTPGNINQKAFNAMSYINGSGQEESLSSLKIAEKMIRQATDEQAISITASSIAEKFNNRRDVVKNKLMFPDGTPDKIKEAIVSRLASDNGYKHFTKLCNEIGLVNYKVEVRDDNNFHLEGVNAENTSVSVLNCIGGAYSVNTYGINAFNPPINGGISQEVINYYQNN